MRHKCIATYSAPHKRYLARCDTALVLTNVFVFLSSAAVLDAGYGTANKLDITTKSDVNGGTTLKSTFTRAASDKISAVLTASSKLYGVAVSATADGAGTIKAKASMSDVIDGVKLTVDTSLTGGAKIADIATPKVTADYIAGDVAASATVSGSSLEASATYTIGDICIGAATSYDSAAGTLGDPSIAASYTMGDTSMTAVMNGLSADDMTATVAHTVSDDISLAGTFASKDSSFSVGAAYTIDSASSVKAKINSAGLLNLGYARKMTGASINAGLEVDTNNMDSRKLGVSMSLS